MTVNHPRRYRVRRLEPGIDWSSWANTYHPTIEAARKAAEAYLRGASEKYRSYGGRTLNNRSVVIGERQEFRGYASYPGIEKIEYDASGDLVAVGV